MLDGDAPPAYPAYAIDDDRRPPRAEGKETEMMTTTYQLPAEPAEAMTPAVAAALRAAEREAITAARAPLGLPAPTGTAITPADETEEHPFPLV